MAEQGTTTTTPAYSIWLSPRGALASKLQGVIASLAAEHEGSPLFLPHVTLAADIFMGEEEAVGVAERLASELKPYKLDFEQVSYGDKYFQCVYVLIKPTEEVVEAARAARKAFGLDENARYMPHLSLLYGKVDSGVRAQVAGRMQGALIQQEDPTVDKGFMADELSVWYTPLGDPSIASWRLVKAFRFKGGEPTA